MSVICTYVPDRPEINHDGTVGAEGNATASSSASTRRRKRRPASGACTAIALDGLTPASTVEDVAGRIFAALLVPPSHQYLEVRTRHLRKPASSSSSASSASSPSTGDPMVFAPRTATLASLGVVMQAPPGKDTEGLPAAFHLRTRIAVKEYGPGGLFHNKYRRDGEYRRETLTEAMSNSYSVTLVVWMWNKHWVTRFILICFILSSLVASANSVFGDGWTERAFGNWWSVR